MRLLAIALLACSPILPADTLQEFGDSFWQWRARAQPFSSDDIPRIERPADLSIDWSTQAMEKRAGEWAALEARWQALEPKPDAAIQARVDYRLLGSALARAHWEHAIERGWQRNPSFYIDQTLGAMFLLLLPPAPFEPSRQQQLVARIASIPATLLAAQVNLTDMRAPFAKLAIDALDNLPDRFAKMQLALNAHLSGPNQAALTKAIAAAVPILEDYREWLRSKLPGLREDTAIGRENYLYFLSQVALSPYSPEQLLAMSRQEWSRAVAFETYEQARNAGLPELPLFVGQRQQINRERADEEKIRGMLVKQRLLTVPDWLKHYRNLPLPAYLEPFESLSVTDDLTGPSRLTQDATSYIRVPSRSLGFFNLSTAMDPRPIVVHEGVPGHYFQMALSWANPDPIRRHYYDSGANEGIGFYAEETMLQAGLFDDSPRSREIIYRFMRLRALRVEVDVKLALGEFTLRQAADYLSSTVPMDAATALDEAAMFAGEPGQAITYQIGKIQITNMLSDARRAQGNAFSLLKFNDFVWSNGNVPLSLQRWELLGDASEVPALKVP